MRSQKKVRLFIGLISAVTLIAFLIIGFAIINSSGSVRVNPPLALVATPTGAPTILPAATIAPTSTPQTTPTPTITPTNRFITVITPTVAVGELMQLPFTGVGDFTIRRAANPSRLSFEEAMQIIYDNGMHRKPGDQYEGKIITVQAVYGLVTIGREMDLSGFAKASPATPHPECKNWAGICHIEVQTCTPEGKCTPTGKIIGRYENRPTWLIEFANTP